MSRFSIPFLMKIHHPNEHLIAKIGVDAAENGPFNIGTEKRESRWRIKLNRRRRNLEVGDNCNTLDGNGGPLCHTYPAPGDNGNGDANYDESRVGSGGGQQGVMTKEWSE